MIIKNNPDEIQNYLVDASNFKGNCEAVYIPENENEISELLKKLNKDKIPVTISGNGTGLTGARVPQSGVVISTERLNKIIEINEKNEYAVVQPGVILAEFQNLIKDKNLLYPPDPTEKNCFIGGTVATNASGEKTFKYGPTRDYVLELNVVLANGDLIKLHRGDNSAKEKILSLTSNSKNKFQVELPEIELHVSKNASGYYCRNNMDAIDLFIGSEGTLGIITEISM